MKKIALLLSTLVLAMILFAIVLWQAESRQSFDRNLQIEIDQQIDSAIARLSPESTLDLGQFYNLPQQISLLVPKVGGILNPPTLKTISSISNDYCQRNQSKRSFNKSEKLDCDFGNFDESLLKEPPYLHGSGYSYALLLVQAREDLLNKPGWLIENFPFFHLSEISTVFRQVGGMIIGKVRPVFSVSQIIALSDVWDNVFTNDRVLGIGGYYAIVRAGESPYKFEFYNPKDFADSLMIDGLKLASKNCDFTHQNMCWQIDHQFRLSRANQQLLVLASLLFLFTVGLAVWLFFYLREEYEAAKSRRLSLEILSHELRTPVSALILQFENMVNRSSDDEINQHITGMSQNIFRLQRLVEDTKKYLNVKAGEALESGDIPSLRRFLEELIEPLSPGISIAMDGDYRVAINYYWLSLCLKNIVKNAVEHGASPITIQVRQVSTDLQIIVEDSGEYIEDKVKGMGLGLNIIKSAAEKMGAKLVLKYQPTRCGIIIKGSQWQKLL